MDCVGFEEIGWGRVVGVLGYGEWFEGVICAEDCFGVVVY